MTQYIQTKTIEAKNIHLKIKSLTAQNNLLMQYHNQAVANYFKRSSLHFLS